MITVPEKVQEIVLESSFYRKGISEGLINLSSLARKIRPEIEKELLKPVSEASVVMALKRISASLTYDNINNPQNHLGDINLRSNLLEFTYKNSPTLHKKIEKLLSKIDNNEAYLTFVKGVWQTTIIASKSIKKDIEGLFLDEVLDSSYNSLSSITVKLTNNHINEPGIMAFVLNALSWDNVNIVEVVSTFDELTVIVEEKDVNKAFTTINKLKAK